ncbi:MAG: nuclease SbcCD subunit D [Candidatus Babeliales bacterium]
MIKFLHTADIHFGMENYGRIDPKSGIHTRLLDFQKALNVCIDHAIAHNVDFFMFSGDAYKTAHPSPTQQKLFFNCLMRLFKANIPVVIVIGNHDNPLSFGKAHSLDIFQDLPLEGFHVIAKPTILPLQTKSGLVNIVGIPWPTRNTVSMSNTHVYKNSIEITEYISKAVAAIIADCASKLDPKIPAILAGHLTVSSGVFSGSEKRAIYGNDPLFLPSQLAIKPFDYVALGHLHRYQNLNPNGHPAIVYSGSIERIDFGERKEDKGFCLVQIESKEKTTHQFIKGPARPFIQVEVYLEPGIDQTQQILNELEKHELTDAVVKIVYHIPPGKKDLVDIKALERTCLNAMYLVGIIPVRKPESRERRAAMNVEMDLPTLLGTYFLTKPELKDKKDQLIEKAMQLYEESQKEIASE